MRGFDIFVFMTVLSLGAGSDRLQGRGRFEPGCAAFADRFAPRRRSPRDRRQFFR